MLRIVMVVLMIMGAFWSLEAFAFSTTITQGSRTIYLRVGDGGFTGTLNNGGSPQNNTTINIVSATISANALGNGVSVQMVSNATRATSFWDNYAFCDLPNELYVGGYYRYPNNTNQPQAILTATFPQFLTNTQGETIPFSDIRWTSTGNGDTGTQIIPAGSFDTSPKTLSSWTRNTWNESCHNFRYDNELIVGNGVYTGRVVYTLSLP